MRKIILVFAIGFFTFLNINAQKIEIKKVFRSYTFSQNDKKLTLNQMQDIMKNNQEAFNLVKSSKTNQTWGMILGAAGGALVGFPIGTTLGGGEPKWALAGAGVALIVATIPIMKNFNKKTTKAVALFNADELTANSDFQPEFNLNFQGIAMGLSMRF
jgi:uncharacterized protein YcfJ